MIIPSFSLKTLTDKDGNITSEAFGFFSLLTEALQTNLNNEGYFVPPQPTSTIEVLNTPLSTSAILYDSVLDKFKGCENGVFKILTSSISGVLAASDGGTGVDNGDFDITLSGNFTTTGPFDITLNTIGETNLTLPSSGDLVTTTIVTLPDLIINESQVTNLVSDLASKLSLSGGTMTGNLILNADATLPLQAVTLEQLNAVIAGLTPKPPCYASTTANLTSWTYNNGASGIGATLTAPSTGIFTTDGTTPPVGSIIFVSQQTTTFQNGIYSLTTSSSGSAAVLTRVTYYDTPIQIQMGDYFPIENGTLYAGTFWYQTATVTAIGTSPITFTQFNLILAGTGLTRIGNTISLINPVSLNLGGTNAALTASNGGIVYSSASALGILSGTATANQIVMSGSSSAPAWSTATYPVTTTVNQILYSSSNNAITGLTTANNGVLITGGTGIPSISSVLPSGITLVAPVLGTPASGTLTNCTGLPLTTGITGLLPLANGGTAANLTASNGGIFYSTASAGAILAGTSVAGKLLTSGANTAPAWTTTTYPLTNTVNTLLYASSTNVMSALTTANNGVLITSSGGVPSISSTLPAAVQSNITQLGTITAPLSISQSGTSPMIMATQITNANANFIEFSNPNAGSGLKGYIGLDGIGMLNLSTDSMVIASDTSGTQNILLVAGGSHSYNLNLQPNGVIFTGGGSTLDNGSGSIIAGGSISAVDTTGYFWYNFSTSGNVYKAVSSNSGGLTFTDIANTLTTLTIGTNGSLTALNNILDNAAHGCQFGTSGTASMIFGNGVSPSTFDMRGTFVFGQGDPASGGSFNVASSSSITANKAINIGNNTATPSTTTILGAVIINNAGSNSIGIGTGSFSSIIGIGNASATTNIIGTVNINAPTSTSTTTLGGNGIVINANSTGSITIGNALNTISIGDQAGLNSIVSIQPGTGSGATNIANSNSYSGTIKIGGTSGTLNIGTNTTNFIAGATLALQSSGTLNVGDTTNTTTQNIQTTTNGTINIGTNLVGGTLNLGHINTNAVGGVGGVVNIEGGLVFGFPTAYSTGTASTSGASNTVTGSGTTWNTNMIGGVIMVTSGTNIGAQVGITAVGSTTSLTTDAPITIASGSSYIIYFLSHQISSRSVSLCTSGNQTSFTVGTNTYSGPITLGNSVNNGGTISLLTDTSGKVVTANNTLDNGSGVLTINAASTEPLIINNSTGSGNTDIVLESGGSIVGYLAYVKSTPNGGMSIFNGAGIQILKQATDSTSDTSLLTANNTLDNGSGAATFAGLVTGSSGFSGNLTGTILTASQTNITSVGTLGALNVNGSAATFTTSLNSTHQISNTSSSLAYPNAVATITGPDVSNAPTLTITRSGTTVDKRVMILMQPSGSNGWEINTDTQTNGTNDFGVYSEANTKYGFKISAFGQFQSGTTPQFTTSAPTSSSSLTITAAEMITNGIVGAPTGLSGNFNWTFDTGANIYAAMDSPAVGTTAQVLIINGQGSFTGTLTNAASGTTLFMSSQAIPPNTSALIYIRVTGTNTVTIYR